MFDFIKSLDLSEEIKSNEIYYLFKTDSSEINLNFLSSLQKFKTNQEFLYYYTNQDCKSVIDIFYNISSITSEICKDEKYLFQNNKNEQYISGVSKIIFLFLILQEYNKLLGKILMNTKQYIKKFYIDFHLQKNTKEKIKSCINDLTCSSIVTSRRNYSRRSTKEETIISLKKLSDACLFKNKQQEMNSNSNEDEYLFQIKTPKFDEEENYIIKDNKESKNESNNNDKINLNNGVNEILINKKESKKISDSTLTLAKMNFILEPEFEEMKLFEKTKSQDNYQRKENKRIKSLDNLNNKLIQNDKANNLIDIPEKNKQILVKFLDSINNLYKEGKINSEIKKSMKKLIISDSKKIIDRFINLNNNNKTFNNIFMKNNINGFLFTLKEELQ
jgi:hypothetical protein